jgi:hypothetical protein
MQLKNNNNFKVRGSIKYVNVVFLALFMHRMLTGIKERKILGKGSQIEIKLDFFSCKLYQCAKYLVHTVLILITRVR